MTIPGPRAGGGTWTENRTIYVDPVNGLDTNDGTCPATAVKTFAQGYTLVSALSPTGANRARLALTPGTWTLTGTFTWALDGVVIEGMGGRDETIIEYAGTVLEITGTDCEFKNLRIRVVSPTTGNAIWIRSGSTVLFTACRLSSYDTGSGVLINHASAVVTFSRCVIENTSATVTSPCMTITSCTRVETHDCSMNARMILTAGNYADFNSVFQMGDKYGYYIGSTIIVTLIGTKIVSTGGLACVYAGGSGLVSVLGCFLDNGGSAAEIVGASTTYPIRCEGTVMRNGIAESTRQWSNIHRTGAGQYGVDQHINLDAACERFVGYKIVVMLDGDIDVGTIYPTFLSGSDVIIDGRGRWQLYTSNPAYPRIICGDGCKLTLQNLETYQCITTLGVTGVLIVRRCVFRSQLSILNTCTADAALYVEDSTFIAPDGYACIAVDDADPSICLTNSNFYCYSGGAKPAITLGALNQNIEISGCVLTGIPADPTTVYPIANAAVAILSHRNSYNCDPFVQVDLTNSVVTPYDVVDAYVGTHRREP